MNKKGNTFGIIIMLFVGIIFALALIEPIANTQSEMTTKQIAVNESTNLDAVSCILVDTIDETDADCNITILNDPSLSTWKPTLCPISGVSLTNDNGTALTLSTDYEVFGASGLIQMLNSTTTFNQSMGNVVLIDYTYCGDGYNVDSGARGIANLITLFAIFALFAFVLVGIKFDMFK